MKAYVLHGVGDLRYEAWPEPRCAPNEAIVEVRAAGICSSDIPRIFSKGTYHFPTIPGHEFSGVVAAVGDERNSKWIGKRVSVFPLIPCRCCPQCAAGRYEMCEHYDYVGSRRDGGFAQKVAVPVWNLVELDGGISFARGAMLEPLSVALHAVKRAGNVAGKRVAVIGTGMIGIAAACWARLRGAAEVRVIGRGDAKRALVEEQKDLLYCGDSAKAGLTESEIVIEAVGSPEAVATALRLAAPEATLVLMGNPAGEIRFAQDVYWKILRKQLRLTGTWNSTYGDPCASDWAEALRALKEGGIAVEALVTHTFDQGELEWGLRLMAEHREPYCKVMTLWNE